jgi:hypothetical protein
MNKKEKYMKLIFSILFLAATVSLSAQTKDSVKVEPKFSASGTLTEMQLLYKLVATPEDCTPNERKKAIDWFNSNFAAIPAEEKKIKKP